MENQFAEKLVNDFFLKQHATTRLGILEYYCYEPPEECNGMYLFWAASQDERLSERAQKASVVLEEYFLSNRNAYISLELAHRQAKKVFKRLYLERNVLLPANRRACALPSGGNISNSSKRTENANEHHPDTV